MIEWSVFTVRLVKEWHLTHKYSKFIASTWGSRNSCQALAVNSIFRKAYQRLGNVLYWRITWNVLPWSTNLLNTIADLTEQMKWLPTKLGFRPSVCPVISRLIRSSSQLYTTCNRSIIETSWAICRWVFSGVWNDIRSAQISESSVICMKNGCCHIHNF